MLPHWYKNAIIYGLQVDTFQDSNGDGIGDFAGLRNRLDYLTGLGMTCLWVLPFFPTSGRDNGYDVTNYYTVDPHLGSLEEFVAFVREAGERGIRVMMDLVMNHTSDHHPWFQASRRDTGSRFRDYYVWTHTPPPMPPGERNIFPDTESGVWAYDDPASWLSWMKRLIAVRRQCTEIGCGTFTILDAGQPGVFTHCCEADGAAVVAIHNLSKKSVRVTIPMEPPARAQVSHVFGSTPGKVDGVPLCLRLGGYDYAWYRVEPER